MATTGDHALVEQFVLDRLTTIDRQSSQCNADLSAHSSRCPSTLDTSEMDTLMLPLITVHQKRLLKNISCRLAKYNACIEDNILWKKLSSYHLTIEQVWHTNDLT